MTLASPSNVIPLMNPRPFVRALQDAGLTIDDMMCVELDPAVAVATVQAIRDAVQASLNADEAATRRMLLEQPIKRCAALETKQRNLLVRNGLETIGDLALRTEREVQVYSGVGPQFISTLEQLLADNGFEFLRPMENPLERAIALYGGAEYVPTSHMYLWQAGLDQFTHQYLRDFPTLGELATSSAAEYMEAREAEVDDKPLSIRKQQMIRLRDGIEKAGLSLRQN